ncbi:MAG TPA: hypothetical protein VE441_00810, partial [Mycobacterium sp.]|nr:hypothetical protein [Mycobacterium sp.]
MPPDSSTYSLERTDDADYHISLIDSPAEDPDKIAELQQAARSSSSPAPGTRKPTAHDTVIPQPSVRRAYRHGRQVRSFLVVAIRRSARSTSSSPRERRR